MILIIFLLFQISFNPKIEIYQKNAILGEPIIAESNIEFMDIINYSNDFYVEIEGSKHFCINLKEIIEGDIFNVRKRVNISNLIKESGEYKISFIYDPFQTCKMDGLTKEEKEENKEIKEELEKAKKEGRQLDGLKLSQKLKKDKDEERENFFNDLNLDKNKANTEFVSKLIIIKK